MDFASLLIFILVLIYAKANIPDHIHEQLEGVRTRDDFLRALKLEPTEERLGVEETSESWMSGTPIRLNKGGITIGSRSGSDSGSTPDTAPLFRQINFRKTGSAPQGSGLMPGHDGIIDGDTPPADGVETISNPLQSSDKCIPMDVCVPTPALTEPNVLIFPRCIELPQCVGSCCDGANRCHAQQKQPVRVLVERFKYSGVDNAGQAKFDSLDKKYYMMEKHLSCGCKNCRVTRSCPVQKEMKECDCRCKNSAESTKCTAPWEWSESSCSCECGITSCSAGRVLDTATCRCVSVLPHNLGKSGGTFRRGSILNDLSVLPTLTHQRTVARPTGIKPTTPEGKP